jgi:SAM-dependent methyltransferase
MRPTDRAEALEPGLAEQIAYYRAIAPEYEEHAIPGWGGDELVAALDSFRPTGSVLELACGTGAWTRELLRHAASLTAIDASPEMLAIARARISDERVRFIQAEIFSCQPNRRYDVVAFSFWLSHVPLEHFERFWSLVAECLEARRSRVLPRRRTPDSRRTDRRRVLLDRPPAVERWQRLSGHQGSPHAGGTPAGTRGARLAGPRDGDLGTILLGSGRPSLRRRRSPSPGDVHDSSVTATPRQASQGARLTRIT